MSLALEDYEDVSFEIGRTRFGSHVSASEFYAGQGCLLKNGRAFQLRLEFAASQAFLVLYETSKRFLPREIARSPAQPLPEAPAMPEQAAENGAPEQGMDILAAAVAMVMEDEAKLGLPAEANLEALLDRENWKLAVELIASVVMPICNDLKRVAATMESGDVRTMSPGEQASLTYLQHYQQEQALGELIRKSESLLQSKMPAVAFLALPESGKSYLISCAVRQLLPPDLVQASMAGTPLEGTIRTAHELRDPPALAGHMALQYDDDLPLLLDQPDALAGTAVPGHRYFNETRLSGLLLPHGAGMSMTGCPIKCEPVVDGTHYVIELDIMHSDNALDVIRQADEAVRKLQSIDELEEEDSDPKAATDLKHKALDLARSILPVGMTVDDNGLDLPTEAERRVPGAYFIYSMLRWIVNARHPAAASWVNNALYLLTCVGNWGLVSGARLRFPCAPPRAGLPIYSVIDTPGPGQFKQVSRTSRVECILLQEDIASAVVMTTNSREVQDVLEEHLKKANFPKRMLETATNAMPVNVVSIRNVCVNPRNAAQGIMSLSDFNATDKRYGYHQIVPTMIQRCYVSDLDKAQMTTRSHSQPLLLGPTAPSWVDTSAEDAKPWLLEGFLETLGGLVAESVSSMWKGRLQHELVPLLSNLFIRSSAIADLSDLIQDGRGAHTLAPASLKHLSEPHTDDVLQELKAAVSGAEVASSSSAPPPSGLSATAWTQVLDTVAESSTRGHDLCTAFQRCTQLSVERRIRTAATKVSDNAYLMCKHGNKQLQEALKTGPTNFPELPALLLGDLWCDLSSVVVEAATSKLPSCMSAITCQARDIVNRVVFQPELDQLDAAARTAHDNDPEARQAWLQSKVLVTTCQQQFSVRLEVGEQDIKARLLGALEELGMDSVRDQVYCSVMTTKFQELYKLAKPPKIKVNVLRLERLAEWAPTAASMVKEALLERVREIWQWHLEQLMIRVRQALESQADLASGLLNGDWDAVGSFPLFQRWRLLRDICAEAISALDKAQLVDRASRSEILQATARVLEVDRQADRQVDASNFVVKTKGVSEMQDLPDLPNLPAAGSQAAQPDPGASSSWRCPICECSDLDCPTMRRIFTPGSSAPATKVCRACYDAMRKGGQDRRTAGFKGEMSEDEQMRMREYVCFTRRPTINRAHRARGEAELPALEKVLPPWVQPEQRPSRPIASPTPAKRARVT